MIKRIIDIFGDILDYIFNIKLFDVPALIAYLAVSAGMGYCAALILIGFPCTIYESITKKKINDDIENKVIKIVAICFVIILWSRLLYELSSK